jgi:hypothetical protein
MMLIFQLQHSNAAAGRLAAIFRLAANRNAADLKIAALECSSWNISATSYGLNLFANQH